MDKRIEAEPAQQPGLQVLADKAFQEQILPGVSRAFASAVPALPANLRPAIANIYLLARLAESISDQLRLDVPARQEALRELLAAAEQPLATEALATGLCASLPDDASPTDRQLIRRLPRILRVSHALPRAQQRVVQRLARSACETRIRYLPLQRPDGLASLALFDGYCAGTAGAVAEATTSLLCQHSPAIARHANELTTLGPSFGEGVQIAHLLKGLWEDRRRGICWLPRDVFLAHGCRLEEGADWSSDPGFHAGLAELAHHACAHLRDGLAYTLLIPTTFLWCRYLETFYWTCSLYRYVFTRICNKINKNFSTRCITTGLHQDCKSKRII